MNASPAEIRSRPAGAGAPQRGRPMKARPKLLEAAIQEFAASGYDGATTAGIARRAKAPQPLVHHHFGSKENLFREALDVLFKEFRSEVLEADAGQGDVGAILRRFILFTARRPQLVRIWVIESARRGPHAKYVIEKYIRPLTELMRPVLRSTVSEGVLPAVDETLLLFAAQGIGSYPFLVTEQVRQLSGMDAQSDEFAKRYADAALAIIGLGAARRWSSPMQESSKGDSD
jgi:AcrR family transcriptional regulator